MVHRPPGNGPLCCKPVGDVSQMCEVLGGYEWGYVAGRWVWSNAASEEQSSRLEALPRSLPSGSQSCLICVDRTHFGQDRPGRRGRLVGPRGGICSVVTHGGEHDVGESPFQAAQGFPFRLAGSAFAFVVDAAFGVATNLGDGDGVEGPVELPIPARVEPVSDGATGGGGQRCGAVPLAAANAFRLG